MPARDDTTPTPLLEEPDWAWRRRGPTPLALRAFGADTEALRRLPGGAGHVWTDGRLVLKPVGCVPEHDWVCEVYAAWSCSEVRVPEPVRPAGAAAWSTDGWGAHVFVPGRDLVLPGEIETVREAGDLFHAAIAALPRPAFLDARRDPWSYADRVAWEDAAPWGDDRTVALMQRLRSLLEPVTTPSQVVHGDLLPNVLVAEGRAPAVIDWPPYHRPVGLASAVAVVDALTFRDAPLHLLDDWATGADWGQLLVRALLYRLAPTAIFAAHDRLMGNLVHHLDRLERVLDPILARAGH